MPINDFLRFLQFEKRFSGRTLTAYRSDLQQFAAFLHTTYGLQQPEQATHTYIRSWIVSLMEAQMDSSSVNRKISALKSFYRFLLMKGSIDKNPMLKVQSPKRAKRLPVFVAEDNMQQLIEGFDMQEDSFEMLRNRVVIELFYATGIRLSELLNLSDTDIDYYGQSIKVLGKRNKERIIPVNQTLLELLARYKKIKEEKFGQATGRFIVTDTGRNSYPKHIYRMVNTYLSAITTLSKTSPHVLRHTFATHLLNQGADLNAIKELLGHASLAATQVYTHNSIEKLKSIYKQAHPRA